jgi:hypothetical protein
MSTERLARDLARKVAATPSVTGLGLHMCTLLTWDPSTLTGSVDLDGTVLSDLPIESATDAFSWTPGETVLVHSWHPPDGHKRRGFGSYWIRGRLFRPGAENAAKVLDALRNSFASQISAEVFGDRIHTATVAALETTASDTFVDLDTVGPTVPDVEIVAGIAVVLLNCGGQVSAPTGIGSETQYLGVAVSGATTRAATTADSYALQVINHNVDGVNHSIGARAGIAVPLTGLNPGTHTFTAKYRIGFSGETGSFYDRTMIVIAL